MRGNSNTRSVSRFGITLLVLLFPLLIIACSSSDDADVEPTSMVGLTPTIAATAASTPTLTPAPPTQTPPTKVPVAPTPTTAPQPTATSVPVPTATATAKPAPPTPTPFPLGGDFFLNLIEPLDLDVFANSSTMDIVGQSRVDAVITVNDDVVVPDADGMFEHTVSLEEGINIIEVVGSVSSGEQVSYVITVVYLP